MLADQQKAALGAGYETDTRDLREHLAPLLGLDPKDFTQARMTYDLRRLRLHGLIERIPKSHRYHVTDLGYRAALLLHRTYVRTIRPTLSVAVATDTISPSRLRLALERVDQEIQRIWSEDRIAA